MSEKTVMVEKKTRSSLLEDIKRKNFKGSWVTDLSELPRFILSFALGIGIALTVLGAFATGLGAGTAQNTVNNVIGYFNANLVTFGSLIILAVFVSVLYVILKDKGII